MRKSALFLAAALVLGLAACTGATVQQSGGPGSANPAVGTMQVPDVNYDALYNGAGGSD